MRRAVAIGVWIVATLAATAMAWQAVDAVGHASTGALEDRVSVTISPRAVDTPARVIVQTSVAVEPPTAPETTALTVPEPGEAPTTTVGDDSSGADSTDSSDNGSVAGPSETTSTTTAPEPPTTAVSTSTPSGSTTTTTVTTPPTTAFMPPTTAPTTTVPPTVPPTTQPSSITQTFFLTGGTVTVEFSETSVTALVTAPNVGFAADVRTKTTTEIDVRFVSDTHQSRLRAWWLDGPDYRIQD